jgi:GNAT superfamily N-acetyltransferase
VEVGETWLEAAERECREETGWHVTVTGVFGAYSDPATQMFTYADGRWVQFFGVVFLANALQQVGTPDAEVLEAAFFSTDSLPAPLFVPDRPVLMDFVSGRQPPVIAQVPTVASRPTFPPREGATGHPQGVSVLAQLPVLGSMVALREAVAEDVPALVHLLAADQLGSTRDGISTAADLQRYLRAFVAIDADPAHLLLVAAEGTQILATMQLSFLPGLARRGALRAQIEAVRVRQDHRSRGLGAALFEWATQEARRRGCTLVQLTTDKSRADAHRFYERLGFVASHEGLKLTLHP